MSKMLEKKKHRVTQSDKRIVEIDADLDKWQANLDEAKESNDTTLRKAAEDTIASLNRERRKLVLQKEKLVSEVEFEQESDEDDGALESAPKAYVFDGVVNLLTEKKFGFLRESAKIFEEKTFVSFDKKRKIEVHQNEVVYFNYADIRKSFLELGSKQAMWWFRAALEGKTITTKTEDGTVLEYTGPNRVYYRMVNQLSEPDNDTYNLINLTDAMRPTKPESELPWVMQSLFDALGGCKAENSEWLMKHTYAITYADVGNNLMAFPVIFGDGKIGKNALYDVIVPSMLGKSRCMTATWDTMDSNFNQFLLGKVFAFVDELPERANWDKIKNMSGSLSSYVKVKYGPEFEISNTLGLVFGGNCKTYPLPFEQGRQMSRVSPIKANGTTFAELVYYRGNDLFGEGFMEAEYEKLTNLSVAELTEADFAYEIGDKYLRNTKWATRENVQQLMNYLHTRFSPAGFNWNPDSDVKFVLNPLRGQDWEEISKSRKDPLEVLAKYFRELQPDYIIIDVAYEMYKIMFKSKYSAGINCKNQGNFKEAFTEALMSTHNCKRVRVDRGSAAPQIWVLIKLNKRPDVTWNRDDYILDINEGTKHAESILINDPSSEETDEYVPDNVVPIKLTAQDLRNSLRMSKE